MAALFVFFRRYYPFTLTGTLLFVVATILFAEAFATASSYLFLFSLLSYVLLGMLALFAALQSFRLRLLAITRRAEQPLYSRLSEMAFRFHIAELSLWPLFRCHYIYYGRFDVGRDLPLWFRLEAAASPEGEITLPLWFALSGRLEGEGRREVRDIFGLVRAATGATERWGATVLPPSFGLPPGRHLMPSRSEESSRRQEASDEDRYMMREYIPGDRIKDINWKSSMRLQQLITRVSPLSPEESQVIDIEFRNYNRLDRDDYCAVMHLNYLKSWLVSFLLSSWRDRPHLQFRVRTSNWVALLTEEGDLAPFREKLALLNFVAPGSALSGDAAAGGVSPVAAGDLFLFSTPYDDLRGVAARPGTRIHLLRTRWQRGRIGKGVRVDRSGNLIREEPAGARTIHLFRLEDLQLLPGRRLWCQRLPESPALPGVATLEEESLRLRLL